VPAERAIKIVFTARGFLTGACSHYFVHREDLHLVPYKEFQPVAVVKSVLCPEGGGCKWCDELRAWIKRSRVF